MPRVACNASLCFLVTLFSPSHIDTASSHGFRFDVVQSASVRPIHLLVDASLTQPRIGIHAFVSASNELTGTWRHFAVSAVQTLATSCSVECAAADPLSSARAPPSRCVADGNMAVFQQLKVHITASPEERVGIDTMIKAAFGKDGCTSCCLTPLSRVVR